MFGNILIKNVEVIRMEMGEGKIAPSHIKVTSQETQGAEPESPEPGQFAQSRSRSCRGILLGAGAGAVKASRPQLRNKRKFSKRNKGEMNTLRHDLWRDMV